MNLYNIFKGFVNGENTGSISVHDIKEFAKDEYNVSLKDSEAQKIVNCFNYNASHAKYVLSNCLV